MLTEPLNSLADVKNYLVIESTEFDNFLSDLMQMSMSYIYSQTYITELDLEEEEALENTPIRDNFKILQLLIIEQMFSQRNFINPSTNTVINLNPIAKSILNYYSEEYIF